MKNIDKQSFLSLFEQRLKDALSSDASVLGEVARYSALDGGKRIRPLAVYLGYCACDGGDINAAADIAVCVELIHSYSLVHDDLPAMDNDSFRRGKPSTHKQFGEANAILGGDYLLTRAFAYGLSKAALYGDNFVKALAEVANAAESMADGQALELSGCRSEGDFLYMYSKKTAAMIANAFTAGAIYAGLDEVYLAELKGYAEALGTAFQLADDLLDEGEEGSLCAAIGIKRTQFLLKEYTDKAISRAEKFDGAYKDALINFAADLAVRTR